MIEYENNTKIDFLKCEQHHDNDKIVREIDTRISVRECVEDWNSLNIDAYNIDYINMMSLW